MDNRCGDGAGCFGIKIGVDTAKVHECENSRIYTYEVICLDRNIESALMVPIIHQPECVTCQCPLTVKHILIECSDFRDIHNKYFVASTMKDVFEQVGMRNVINFIK